MTSSFLIQWQNISVTVTEKRYSLFRASKNTKVILRNISGFAASGSLIAVMGPSGSGKTTFLGAVSGRIKGKEGMLKINNTLVSDKDMCNISGYMQQEDVFTESLTVYEHMKFMAALKLRETEEERIRTIKNLLIELCLDESESAVIGALSGGQRRRLSLATELLGEPYVLFCDEPTSGLDSFSAMNVVKMLEATALAGKAVLVTLHQPSSQIFDLFNNIILLADGKLVFQGSKHQIKQYFERLNLYCPDSYNPAEFYIKCVTMNAQIGCDFKGALSQNNFKQTLTKNWSDCLKKMVNKKNYFVQLRWLTWRDFIDFKRGIYRYKTSYALLVITAVIIATSFSNVDLNGKSSVQNIQGVLVLMISELVFTHMYYVIYTFPGEVTVFIKEKSVYSAFPYYFSKVMTHIIPCLVNTATFLSVYFVVLKFLHSFDLFLSMFIVLFFTSLSGTSLGLCLSAVFPTVEYVNLFTVPFEIVVMIVSGIWIKIDTLPEILSIIKYFSPFYYGFQSISVLCWERVDFLANCTGEDELPCFTNGREVLKHYSFYEEYDIVAYNILYLFILILVYCFIGYLGILRKRTIYESY